MAEVIEQQEQNVSESNAVHKSRSGFWFGIIIVLIIIGVAGAGFLLFTQLREQQEDLGGELNKGDQQLIELSKQLNGYQSQLSSFQSQLATVQADVAGKNTHFTKTLADFSQLHNEKLDSTRKELNNAIQQVQRQLGKTRGDWLIADAEYLLSVANQRLHLVGDVDTTKEALEAADQRLRESGDAAAFKVREQIAKDITRLNSIKVPDIVGIYAAIQTLEGEINKLKLLLPYADKELSPSKEVHAPADKTEPPQEMLDGLLNKLGDAVTIRHSEQPITSILTREQVEFIREQLSVKLGMVKTALVQGNEPLYQATLDDTKKWTEQHFTHNAEARNFIAELDKYKAIKIRSQFPDISLSLKMLRDISKLRIETDKAAETPEVSAPAAPPATPVAK